MIFYCEIAKFFIDNQPVVPGRDILTTFLNFLKCEYNSLSVYIKLHKALIALYNQKLLNKEEFQIKQNDILNDFDKEINKKDMLSLEVEGELFKVAKLLSEKSPEFCMQLQDMLNFFSATRSFKLEGDNLVTYKISNEELKVMTLEELEKQLLIITEIRDDFRYNLHDMIVGFLKQ